VLHEPHDVRRHNFVQVARFASEPELQEAVGKSPAMIDGPLAQSALIAKIVFVFQLEKIVRRFCVFAFDACLGFSHFFAPFQRLRSEERAQSGAPLQGWRHRLC
jgi:hypothetical protein